MDRVFEPIANVIVRVVVFGGVGVVALVVGVSFVVAQRSVWSTDVGQPVVQPVAFSHAHHVSGLGIDCRYCHTAVGESASAGMPTASTCMNCHAQLYTTAEMLEPVRESWRTGEMLAWRRVHDLKDFVYFHHGAHVSAGVSCATCHGEVGEMPLMWKAEAIDMGWCLDCHRHPEVEEVAEPVVPTEWARAFEPRREVTSILTNCTACHR